MKTLVVLSFLIAVTVSQASGQKTEHKHHAGHGMFQLRFQSLNGNGYAMYGFSGAYMLNKYWSFGGGGVSSLYKVNYTDSKTSPTEGSGMQFGYGGFLPEFHVRTSDRTMLFLQALIGGGGYRMQSRAGGFLLVEPQLFFSLRITDYLAVEPGISYRQTYGHTANAIDVKQLNGVIAMLQVRYGIF